MRKQVRVLAGDCLEVLPTLPDNSVDSIVTDPPYELGFMGKSWDNAGIAYNPLMWAECLRVLKPGGHLAAFGGTRTYHRMACAIEDAGFEIRDSLHWIYGSGFPKSHDVSKSIDKAARGVPHGGADPTSPNHGKYRTQATEGSRGDGDSGRGYGAGPGQFMREMGVQEHREVAGQAKQWEGWGTALKPAHEPIVLARKPFKGTVAANVVFHGTGALNIGASRVNTTDNLNGGAYSTGGRSAPLDGDTRTGAALGMFDPGHRPDDGYSQPPGRWPPNILLDESAAAEMDAQSGVQKDGIAVNRNRTGKMPREIFGAMNVPPPIDQGYFGAGGASRFFPVFKYQAKAPAKERPTVNGIKHPTVKPLALMEWLIALVTPPGGTVLDLFAGSGTTGQAALRGGFKAILIEKEHDYIPLINARLGNL